LRESRRRRTARRREVFVLDGEARVLRPEELTLDRGRLCVGDGAVRYRALLEERGAEVPPDASELHLPRASLHARLASEFGPADAVAPLYLRLPDADKTTR
jgi:hypothetical protein